MFKIHIRSGKESQQHGGYQYNEYGEQNEYDEYDEYGEYIGPQSRPRTDTIPNECCICGDSITNGHLVFIIKGKEYEIHTSCMVTGMALITNGIALLIELFKNKRGNDKQIESEET